MRKTPATLIGLVALLLPSLAGAQAKDFRVSRGRVSFRSAAQLETINGVSNSASGSIRIDPRNLSSVNGTITVPVASLRTGIELRDEHLRGPEWLDAGHHADATFQITSVTGATSLTANADTNLTIVGRFTLHGVTKEVRAEARVKWDGANGVRARARFSIRLSDFNVSINPAVRLKVSNDITIQVEVLAEAS